MDALAALLLSCSLHLDDPLLLGVIDAVSSANVFAVLDVAGLDEASVDMPPGSANEARLALDRIASLGGSPVVGLLPARLEWFEELGKPLERLFDGCLQVEVASAKISEFDYQCRSLGNVPSARSRRACTLDRYGQSLGLPALGRFVMLQLERSSAPPPTPNDPTALADSLFRPGGLFFGGASP